MRRLSQEAAPTERPEMRTIFSKLTVLRQRDSGQTMAEYAVVLAVLALGVFAAFTMLSGAISGGLDTVTAAI
jgi:Flp pilus assembly pilin Flp